MQKTLFLHQFFRYENFSFTAQPKKHCLNFSDYFIQSINKRLALKSIFLD